MDVFFSALRKGERLLLIALMTLLAVFCLAQVLWRLMGDPLGWSEEVSRYLFVWLTFVGAAAVVGRWGHFQVDVVVGKLPPGFALIFRWLAYAAIIFFAYVMLFHGWELLIRIRAQYSPAMRLPMIIPYAALPLSGLLMLLHLIELFLLDLRNRRAASGGGEA